MYQRNQGGIFNTPDAPTLEVEHLHAGELREK
jgi:hypothetical protein